MQKDDREGETMKEIDLEIYESSQIECEASRSKLWAACGGIWHRVFERIEHKAK